MICAVDLGVILFKIILIHVCICKCVSYVFSYVLRFVNMYKNLEMKNGFLCEIFKCVNYILSIYLWILIHFMSEWSILHSYKSNYVLMDRDTDTQLSTHIFK